MSLQALREQRGVIANALQTLVNKTGEFTAEDTLSYENGLADLDKVDASIKRHNELNAKIAADTADLRAAESLERVAKDKGKADAGVYAKWLKGGDRALNEEDWATIRNTMSTTTGNEGGFSVPSDVSSAFIGALKAYGGMREVSTVIVTESGNPLSYPTTDGTAEVGEWIAENTTATDADIVFGTVPVNVFKVGSKVVTVPIELLQDSAIDVEALTNGRLAERIARVTNLGFTTGTGTAQPFGVQTAAGIGHQPANGTSNVTAATYDALVATQHSVDPAYRANARWMMNDNSVLRIRLVKDGSGRPIFVPGYEMSVPGGAPDTLLGAPLTVNQDMPNMAASVKSILFGDFRKGYVIRDAMGLTLFRFTDSAFSKKGQVGFLAWMRCGGNLVDTGAVKAFRNSAS